MKKLCALILGALVAMVASSARAQVSTNPNNTIVIQVLVTTRSNRGAADSDVNPAGIRLPDEARMMSVKTRKAT